MDWYSYRSHKFQISGKQADSVAALYSSSWQQHFCTAGMKSCCSHANSAQSPSWAEAESFLMGTISAINPKGLPGH